MTYNEHTKKATRKYLQSVDRIGLTLPKGRKDQYKQAAEREGLSLNEFCVSAIENALPPDLKEDTTDGSQ